VTFAAPSALRAGPEMAEPSLIEKRELWHVQMIWPFWIAETGQPS